VNQVILVFLVILDSQELVVTPVILV
jgi:hypothetical protein